ncbi:unnamed protein product [Prunus armeniaca]|uniref:APO domain-containing protein n=1 Tax=Prunus armeniaca TaxID=36596 RepID=A0A6J5W5K0_PRUAR|nr:unnamed protein product [Prunus armeniaca]
MKDQGLTPDDVPYNTPIHGLCQSGKWEKAKSFLICMVDSGISPDVHTYAVLISALCKEERIQEALALYEDMTGKCINPNVFIFNALISASCKCCKWEEAAQLFQNMVDSGISPDVYTYVFKISALCREERIQEALALFEDMTGKGINPNVFIFNSLISASCKCCKWEEVAPLFQNMVCFESERALTLVGDADDPLYADVPRPPSKMSERKPYPTSMKVLIQRAKEEKEARKAQPCRMLEEPPDNGLLVPARQSVLFDLSKLLQVVPVQRCRFCSEVHIGHAGHEIRTCTGPNSGFRSASHVWKKGGVQDVVSFPKCFHLYDRVGKPRVGHDERYRIPRIPAILELCIQAGLEIDEYPTKRRTRPVYCIEGRIVDFEMVNKMDEMDRNSYSGIVDPLVDPDVGTNMEELRNSGSLSHANCVDKSFSALFHP